MVIDVIDVIVVIVVIDVININSNIIMTTSINTAM